MLASRSPGPARPSPTRVALLALTALVALAVSACGDDGGSPEASDGTAPPAEERDEAFCAEMERLQVEQPEEYVGSPEHLEDIEGLLEVSPAEVRDDVETYRDFIAAGGVDPEDPDSNLTENWPPEVQEAVSAVVDYSSERC
jgi:hypothetical protein